MFIHLKGKIQEEIVKMLAIMTDHSVLFIDKIKVDENSDTITLLLDRPLLKKNKKKLFGLIKTPKYDKENKTRTEIIIKNVISFDHTNNYTSGEKQTILERGIIIKRNEIYMCSAEENQGELMFSLLIRVKDCDLTIRDI